MAVIVNSHRAAVPHRKPAGDADARPRTVRPPGRMVERRCLPVLAEPADRTGEAPAGSQREEGKGGQEDDDSGAARSPQLGAAGLAIFCDHRQEGRSLPLAALIRAYSLQRMLET